MPVDPRKALDILGRLSKQEEWLLKSGTPEESEAVGQQVDRVGRLLEGGGQNIGQDEAAVPPTQDQLRQFTNQKQSNPLFDAMDAYKKLPPPVSAAAPPKKEYAPRAANDFTDPKELGPALPRMGSTPSTLHHNPGGIPDTRPQAAEMPPLPGASVMPDDGDLPPEGTPPNQPAVAIQDHIKSAVTDPSYTRATLGADFNSPEDIDAFIDQYVGKALNGRKEPSLFSWENLLILLLAGAPTVVGKYMQEKRMWSDEFQAHLGKAQNLIRGTLGKDWEYKWQSAFKNRALDIQNTRAQASKMRLDKDPRNGQFVDEAKRIGALIKQNELALAKFNLDHQKAIQGLGFENADPEVKRLIDNAAKLEQQLQDQRGLHSAWLDSMEENMRLPGDH